MWSAAGSRRAQRRLAGGDTARPAVAPSRTGIVYDATYARFRYAEALLSAGERDQAKDALRRAAADASGLGALPLRALVDDLARRASPGGGGLQPDRRTRNTAYRVRR
jgi:hypothetical protein